MLIDVSKEELKVIVQQLWKSRKSEANLKPLYDKMEVYLNMCNCREGE